MKIITKTSELLQYRKTIASQTVGFVPTMGALHEGHRSLLERSRAENAVSLLSIFVNPSQFNQASDLQNYPRTWEADLKLADGLVDVIFAPLSTELYPQGYRYQIQENAFSKELCGAFRPGHFEGVLTVVMKLFQIVKPDRAYFGEKDHQQLTLIQEMAKDFFMDLEVIACPTVREEDGLAMSSRNRRLSQTARKKAPALFREMNRDLETAKDNLKCEGFDVEYLVDRQGRRYAAAWLEGVRLIDNIPYEK